MALKSEQPVGIDVRRTLRPQKKDPARPGSTDAYGNGDAVNRRL